MAPHDPKQAKVQGQKGQKDLSQVGAQLKRSTLVPSGPNDPEPPQDIGGLTTLEACDVLPMMVCI
ncbi:hypothetical protein PENSUB_2695 [Penicillium subrubescens]|uniref:Uncharacterized protein n=1 Tax=Penicillium subrubescens TaxID=1316194 RepID=A0A1Q5UHA9_9EURO|nr:hypothetical protein PENSUB_2695 [Penicillium subrubescens]